MNQAGKLITRNARDAKEQVLLDPAEMKAVSELGINPLVYESASADYTCLIYLHKNDVYHYHHPSRKVVRLTDTPGEEQNPVLSPDRIHVVYTREGNLLMQTLANPGKEIALTKDGSDLILNGYASWIYYEEILGRRGKHRAFWFSPDGKKLAFLRFDQEKVGLFPVVWFNELYNKIEMQRYPKPGTPNPEVELYLVDLSKTEVKKVDIPDCSGHYLAFPEFSAHDPHLLYLQWLNRDQNHFRIYAHDLKSGQTRVKYEERQASWVDFLDSGDIVVLPREELLIRSSRDGWHHLLLVDRKNRVRALTKGNWSVDAIEAVDLPGRSVYFSAYREDTTRRNLYRTGLGDGGIVGLTSEPGSHMVRVSPNGKYAVDTFSSLTRPAVTQILNLKSGGKTILSDSITDQYKAFKFGETRLIRIKTPDGIELPVVLTLPSDYRVGQRYPVILTVYGGPGSRGVSDSFSRGYFYSQYLAQQGIVVISADHRGAGHHGKIGMNAMHRRLGQWEMADYGAVIDALITQGIADPERVGITGGSYGGYVTALALCRESSRFRYGIAHFSVTDWSLYDSVYTERYMDTPQENPEGYKESSVFSYIDSYRGGLLLTHGTVDDNVHMQNTLQLADKLQDAGKPFQMMLYPRSRHGYRAAKREFDRRLELEFWMRSFFHKPISEEES
jgi:dipeptidyl-peptidase-4